MSMKLKKTLALVLSLVTVFSAAFTSMADVEVVEELDQIVVPEEPVEEVSDIFNTATVVDADMSVETVEEITEVVSENEPEESSIVPADLLGGKSNDYYFGPNKLSATVSEIFKSVSIDPNNITKIWLAEGNTPENVTISGGNWNEFQISSTLSIPKPIDDLSEAIHFYLLRDGSSTEESYSITFGYMVTAADLFATVPDFPYTADPTDVPKNNGWWRQKGQPQCLYLSGSGKDIMHWYFPGLYDPGDYYQTESTKNMTVIKSGNTYIWDKTQVVYIFHMADGKLAAVSVERKPGLTASPYNLGTYSAPGSFYLINKMPESDKSTNHGYLTFDKVTAEPGATVTIKVAPEKGYQLKAGTLTVAWSHPDGGGIKMDVKPDPNDSAKYTFTMPVYSVKISAQFEELPKITAWKQLQEIINAAGTTPTTITLTQDVIAEPTDSRLVIDDDQTITIDLNGYNIIKDSKDSEGGGNCITVNDRAVLTIKDESTATHNFKVVDGLWVLDDAGDKTLTGGCIMGINPKESDYDGIGVFINSNGTLNLRGGNIVGNKAGRWGGGVNVCENAVFNIYGGNVIGNTAGDNGGGVCVDGELNVYGGSISENTLTDGTTANNVYLKDEKYITIGDNCTAKVGVSTETAPTESAPVKITKNGTAADVSLFTSDNPDYIVAYNENGYLELQKSAQKTIAEILATAQNFPTAIGDGWVNENGCRIYDAESGEDRYLYAVSVGSQGDIIPHVLINKKELATASGNNYIYIGKNTDGSYKVTFCMNDNKLESIKIEDLTGSKDAGNGTYTPSKQITIGDIIAKSKDFPKSKSGAWENENGKRAYALSDSIQIGNFRFLFSTALTESGEDYVYVWDGDMSNFLFKMKEGSLQSIIVSGSTRSAVSNGEYKLRKTDPTPVEKESEEREPLFTGTWNNPVKNGAWSQDARGIWHYASSETFKNTWAYIYNPYAHDGQNTSDWFWFDRQGNMLTGWQQIGGKWYYLHPNKDGVLGSCLIGPAVTPDGHTVDATGAWDGNGTEPVSEAAKAGINPGAASAPYTGTWNAPVQNGAWSLDANGIWHYTTTQQFKNTWAYIYNPYAHDGQHTSDWFWFDEKGNMLTGWQRINGKWYYLHPNKDGVLGSCLIGPTTTPDGYKVDETGARID